MRLVPTMLLACLLPTLTLLPGGEAHACGGCFQGIQETESTQVSGHRMILSISPDRTTLWDQIRYVGNPSSFAWVLPVKGMAEVGLSSDALFANLELQTGVTVRSPEVSCPPPPFCESSSAFTATSGGGDSEGGWTGVTVVAQKVVGPYETVQLSSQDPGAIEAWLVGHGYTISDEAAPILTTYVAEGFDFLALKLVPGGDVQSMRPVRVTTTGAGTALPLRMVAIGAGAKVPISLWVLGEGRYQPANFDWFTIQQVNLVWDWDTSKSNYEALVQEGFAASAGTSWLVEAAEPFSRLPITNGLVELAMNDPARSGYADEDGNGALLSCAEDLDALFGSIDMSTLWVSRLRGDLAHDTLTSDLMLEASATQGVVKRDFTAPDWIGSAPSCPSYPPCNDAGSGSGSGGASGSAGKSGCTIHQGDRSSAALSGLVLAALGLAAVRRRRGWRVR